MLKNCMFLPKGIEKRNFSGSGASRGLPRIYVNKTCDLERMGELPWLTVNKLFSIFTHEYMLLVWVVKPVFLGPICRTLLSSPINKIFLRLLFFSFLKQ